MERKSLWFYDTGIGRVGIAEDGIGITDVFLENRRQDFQADRKQTPLLAQAARELKEYLSGGRKVFEVKLHLAGTPFQIKVWEALCRIPYGQTRSYKEIAESIGNPKACRAVGMANHRNPVIILVPCHRVVGQDGSLTGYAGGLEVKKFLLDLERAAGGFPSYDIRAELEKMAEPGYQAFTSSLIPNIPREWLLGVRLPKLRRLAADIAKGDWRAYLAWAGEGSFEEVMLQGMVIGSVSCPIGEALGYIREFLPRIDNWSVCDSFCAGLKLAETHPEEIWEFIQPYFQADGEYQVRFAVVMLLDYYIKEPYKERVLQLLEGVSHESYYVKMAVAWAVSVFYVRFPEPVMAFLQDSRLDDFTYNKALQKILESRKVPAEEKERIRRMKRK